MCASWALPPFALLCLAFSAQAEQVPLAFLDELCEESFSFRCELKGSSEAWKTGEAHIALNWQEAGEGYLVSTTRNAVQLIKKQRGRETALTKAERIGKLTADGVLSLTLKRRGANLILIADTHLLLSTSDASFTSGKIGTGSTRPDLQFTRLLYQPIEPVYFADDFMRTQQEQSPWQTSSGQWKAVGPQGPAERLANPFTYQGEAGKGSTARTVAGYWFWDDYVVQASTRPDTAEGIGLMAYAQDDGSCFLFRWTAGLVTGKKQLVKVSEGKETLLAQQPGGFEPNQWFRLQVQVEGEKLTALIDGVPVLEARDLGFGQGKVGLYVSGASPLGTAQFDDILVESVSRLQQEPPRPEPVPAAFVKDPVMRRWATEEGWWAGSAAEGYWHTGEFFSEPLLQLPVPAPLPPKGKLVAAICAANQNLQSGYTLEVGDRASASNADSPPTAHHSPTVVRWRLLRLGKVVAETEKKVSTDWRSLLLAQRGGKVVVEAAEEELLRFADPRPLHGRQVGFKAEGWTVERANAVALSRNMEDITFAKAPVDWWMQRGTWESVQRWGCWGQSHFGGYDPVAAIVWSKRAFGGDMTFDCYCANATPEGSAALVHDLNLTICGDGVNLSSGYSFIFAGAGSVTQIRKAGQVVAERSFTGPKQNVQQDWYCLRIEKHGGHLRFFVDQQLLLEYEDPHPLSGGKTAVWTVRGSVVLARLRIWYERLEGTELIPKPWLQLAALAEGQPLDATRNPQHAAGGSIGGDFEDGFGSFRTRDSLDGALLSLDSTTASHGKRSLKVTNRTCGGHFALWVTKEPFNGEQHPVLSFDYKVPRKVQVNLYAKLKGAWYEITFTGGLRRAGREPGRSESNRVLADIQGVVADDRWHHAEFDLLKVLRDRYGDQALPQVESLAIASPDEQWLRLGFGGNPFAASYHLDNFTTERKTDS